jgi:hypothetical protein
LWVHFENFRADRQAFLGHLVVDSDRLFRTSSSESSSLADEEDPETSVNDAEHEKRLANRTLSGASSYSVTPTLRRAASLLRRRFSVHVREHETGISAAASGVVSPDVSEVHSPLSVFHRQHVSIADVTGPNATSLAVKAQQYAVLVTNVDPTSPSIRNPEGSLPANRAAELEVSRAFASLFPDFVAAVPAQWHARVDKRLCELDRKQLALMRVHERIQTCAANDKAAKLLERRDALERETKRLAAEIARADRPSKRVFLFRALQVANLRRDRGADPDPGARRRLGLDRTRRTRAGRRGVLEPLEDAERKVGALVRR